MVKQYQICIPGNYSKSSRRHKQRSKKKLFNCMRAKHRVNPPSIDHDYYHMWGVKKVRRAWCDNENKNSILRLPINTARARKMVFIIIYRSASLFSTLAYLIISINKKSMRHINCESSRCVAFSPPARWWQFPGNKQSSPESFFLHRVDMAGRASSVTSRHGNYAPIMWKEKLLTQESIN